jgi:hydroxyacylglutathione hydrolase
VRNAGIDAEDVVSEELAPGVWLLGGAGHNSLSVEFDDYSVIIEGPRSADRGRKVIEATRALVPQKPIRYVLNTHHHFDHVGGNLALKQATGCTIIGPAGEATRIPGIDRRVDEGDRVPIGSTTFEVIETPGHTDGHVSYWSAGERLAFAGDALFSLGCGRLFEGTPDVMLRSLQKLAELPRDTRLYCGHEYTETNGRFALTIEPNNLDLQARVAQVAELLAAGKMTLPTTVGQELATNPFLRADRPRLQVAIGMKNAAPEDVFGELRRRKDAFA